jgi:hypothetical protein
MREPARPRRRYSPVCLADDPVSQLGYTGVLFHFMARKVPSLLRDGKMPLSSLIPLRPSPYALLSGLLSFSDISSTQVHVRL